MVVAKNSNKLELKQKECQLNCTRLEGEIKSQQIIFELLLHQQEEERKEISRELHDEIAQMLNGINLKLAVLMKASSHNDKDLRTHILDTQDLITSSVQSIHHFAREFRPLILDDLGLVAALTSYIKEFTKQTSIPVSFNAKKMILELSDINQTVLFRVAQEALMNIAKHSKAKKASVKLKVVLDMVQIEIHDNGCSFDMSKLNPAGKVRRLGLLGMTERLKIANGKLSIKSNPKHGTTIKAEVPKL